MSQQFLAAALAGNWDAAYSNLNGLSMYEMLRSLAALPAAKLDALRSQAHRYFGKYNILRVEYALHVVMYRQLPSPAPGDLQATGQVGEAQNFLGDTRNSATLSFEKMPYANERYRGCGAFARFVLWRLNNAHTGTNGYIVQQVTNTFDITDCSSNVQHSRTETYWEGWKVVMGQIVTGSGVGTWFGFPVTIGSQGASQGDLFAMDPTPDTRGMKKKEGWAKYLQDYTEPDHWGSEATFVGADPDQPSTFKRPGLPWSEVGAIYRWYKIEYNCCGGSDSTTFTSHDGDNRPLVP